MDGIVDTIFNVELEEISNFKFPKNKRFGLVVNLNNIKYEFIINLKETSDKLLVLGSGALGFDSKHDKTKPYFNRWSWDFNESTIYYNDPTMYLDTNLRGGWGIGDLNEHYLENIAGILLIISESLQIKANNIILFGSSMGGFMSIILSTLIKGSTAIADIPQLNLSNYYEWEDLKKYCFNDLPEEIIFKKYKHRINAIDMIRHENYIPNAILVFDCSVTPDITLQYAPFVKDLNQLPYKFNDNNIKIRINGKNMGHAPLNKEDTFKLLDKIISKELINENCINKTCIKKNNNLKNKIINNYSEFSLENYSFLVHSNFIEQDISAENTIKLSNSIEDIHLFMSIFGRTGDYCEESFNKIVNTNNDKNLELISSKIFKFENTTVFNIITQHEKDYECIFLVSKNNRTFRLTFNFRKEIENKISYSSEIFKIIMFSLINKSYKKI